MRARAARVDPVQQERAEESARGGADGQRRNAELLHQQQAADDGAQVVDERRHRLHVELLAHQQHRAEHAARKEEQLRRQQDARELHAQRRLLRVVAVEPPVDVPGRENLGQQDGRAQHDVHGAENDRERPLPLLLAAGIAIAGQDGDESDRPRPAHQEIRDHVGQHEGAVERVGGHAPAEEPEDVLDPHQADDARQEGRRHQHQGGGKRRVRVRRPQRSQRARPPRLRSPQRLS